MNVIGLLISFAFIGVVLALGFWLTRRNLLRGESLRKFVHIGVANWWFLLIFCFDSFWMALLGPLLFTIVNGVMVAIGIDRMIGFNKRQGNLGLIYYPFALFVLIVLGFGGVLPMYACGIGALAMGYGDGLAAVIGSRWGKRKIYHAKTLIGSLTMFIVTLLIAIGFSAGYQLNILGSWYWVVGVIGIALVCALLEIFSPWGLDNIIVPLGVALTAFLIWGSG
ncbi:MAG: diacylglycerol/polyprenol kinase family protein [Sphaerochaetaceae bacterium]